MPTRLYNSEKEVFAAVRAWYTREDVDTLGYNEFNDKCVYRGDNGDPHSKCRCSIGCLIPDEDYDPDFDKNNLSFFALTNRYNELIDKLFSRQVAPRLDLMQMMHDHIAATYGKDNIKLFLTALDWFKSATLAERRNYANVVYAINEKMENSSDD